MGSQGGRAGDRTPFLDALQASARRSQVPFYAPGHKQGRGISPKLSDWLGLEMFRADLPELPELDNLFAPEGVLQEAQALAAETFGADRTWFLANGSTAGVLAAILATCGPGEKILLARNVHRSAVSGLILSGAMPIFLSPEYDRAWDIAHGVAPETVERALERHPDAKAILLVSPTYHGACSHLAAIARMARERAVPLVADEAHGAHFAFHPGLPTPALAAGADVAVQSVHKTLGALSQASLLHVRGDRVSPDRIDRALAMVQSTSPNALLLASLDAARAQMAADGERLMAKTLELAEEARERIARIEALSVLTLPQPPTPGFWEGDRTRLTVKTSDLGVDGYRADEILYGREGVTCELPALSHLTFILSPGNAPSDIDCLVGALARLPRSPAFPRSFPLLPDAATALSPREAYFAPHETVAIAEARDRIGAELVCPYPPGIPALIPGEIVSDATLAYLNEILARGGTITGCRDARLQTLQVVR